MILFAYRQFIYYVVAYFYSKILYFSGPEARNWRFYCSKAELYAPSNVLRERFHGIAMLKLITTKSLTAATIAAGIAIFMTVAHQAKAPPQVTMLTKFGAAVLLAV